MALNDRLYWVFTEGETGTGRGPFRDSVSAILEAKQCEGFVLGIDVIYAAHPNWSDDDPPGETGDSNGP